MTDRNETYGEVESRLKDALVEDYIASYGEEVEGVIIMDYLTIANGLDTDGNTVTMYSHPDDISFSQLLGWLAWLETILKAKIVKANIRE